MIDTKEYLKRIALIDAQINGTIADMQRWYDRATAITSQPKTIVSFDENTGKVKKTVIPPAFGSGISDKVGDSVAEYVDIEMESDLKSLLDERQRVINRIRQLTNKDRFDVLWKCYVLNMTNKEIAVDMGRSQTWVSTVKCEAIAELDSMINV